MCSTSRDSRAAGSGWRERARRLANLSALALAVALAAGPPQALADGDAKREVPSLARRLAGARLVVLGRLVQVEPLDDGRVALGRLQVRRVLKGELPGPEQTVGVVEIRDPPSAAPILRKETEVVAFLRPARRGSYLRSVLPAGHHQEIALGRYGVVSAGSAAEADEVAGIVERIAARSRSPELDGARQAAARRELVFAEIGGRHAALVEDGAAALTQIPDLAATLGPEERSTLERALQREDLPERVRVALIDAVATARLGALAGALAGLRGGASVQAARWRALAALGHPPGKEDLERGLASPDAAVRVAAAEASLHADPTEGLAQAARLAREDDDPKVRREVIEVLGERGGAAAIPALERSLAEDPDLATRQAAAQAIFRVGGPEAVAALGRAAFVGPLEEQRRAVAMLRALGVPDDDPALERIRREHGDPQAREIATRGLPIHEH